MCSGEVPELWDRTAFADSFVISHFSCVIKLDKDNEEFYTRTLDVLGSIPSETVYIGDSINELTWAQRLGMIPVLKVRDSGSFWEGLKIDKPIEILNTITSLNQKSELA